MQDYTNEHYENYERDIGYFNALLTSLSVQKVFLLSITLIYFGVYVGIFAFYGADFGYLSTLNEQIPNVPDFALTIIDKIPQLGISMIVSYMTFMLFKRYIRYKRADALSISRPWQNHEAFQLFFKQYAISILYMILLCAVCVPIIMMASPLIAQILISIFLTIGVMFILAKPYISLHYQKAVGIINVFKIMKSVLFSYVIGFILTLLFVIATSFGIAFSGPLILETALLDRSFVMFAFDFIFAFLVVLNGVIFAHTTAYFAHKAISKNKTFQL